MITRREFLKSGSAFAVSCMWAPSPDLILYNANIITVNGRQPRAQAIAIQKATILAVGDNDKIRSLSGIGTRQINLEGKTVVPGFIDAHTHPAYAGRFHLRAVDCDLRSISAIQTAIAERAAKTPSGQWVQGFKYDDTKTAERRFLTRYDLDAAAPQHPVIIWHRGGHTIYVNSVALKIAGVTESTPDPAGGKFSRDPDTNLLTGRVLESATQSFDKFIPSEFSKEEEQQAVTFISKMMSRSGVTSVQDAYGSPEDLRAYQDAYHAGELFFRVYCMIGYTHIDQMIAAGVRTGFGNEWVRVGGMKLTCDGSISERTARLSKPYIGRPDDFGILVMQENELYEYAMKAHQNGWQIGIHANGDVGIDITLRVYERLQKEYPAADPRFRIEHCTMVNPELVQRIKNLKAIPNPFLRTFISTGRK